MFPFEDSNICSLFQQWWWLLKETYTEINAGSRVSLHLHYQTCPTFAPHPFPRNVYEHKCLKQAQTNACSYQQWDIWVENHRITGWLGLEGTLKLIQFQPPCHGQGHLPLDQVAQSPVQPGVEHCQGGCSHSFSGQPVPVPHHPHSEDFLCYT